MSLKIPVTQTVYNLGLLFGQKRLTMKANGADIRFLLINELPSDIADYALRTDINTEAASAVSGLTYNIADEKIYRLSEIVTIYASDDVAKGRAIIVAKPADKITVEKIGDFALAGDDKIFIGSDEILIDGTDEVLFDVFPSNVFLIALASAETADNLQVTTVDSKKKI